MRIIFVRYYYYEIDFILLRYLNFTILARHNDLGKFGEDYAVAYLQQCGFSILCRNWRYSHKEIDIIALEGNILVFVEVKTRKGNVEVRDAISNSKMNALLMAANAYIQLYNKTEEVRFDVLMLRVINNQYHVEHIRSAFR